MHNHFTRVVLCSLASSFPLLAQTQTTVVPSMYATVDGSSWTAYPFGVATPTRNQQLFARSMIAVPVMSIQQLAIRGEPTLSYPGKTGVDLEIGLTTSPVDPWQASTTYASNLGVDYKLAFVRKVVNLPPQTGGSPTAPFSTKFPLDTPFVYLRSAGTLLIDYLIYSQPAGSYSHDSGFTLTAATIAANGTACSGLSQTVTGGVGTGATPPVLTFALAGGPVSGTAFHVLGASLLPAPLPLPYGGCPLYQDALVVSQLPLVASGASFVYPVFSTFKGITVFGQGLAVNSALSAITSSQSHQVTIGGYDPTARMLLNTSVTSATGSLQIGAGMVFEITY